MNIISNSQHYTDIIIILYYLCYALHTRRRRRTMFGRHDICQNERWPND